LLIVPQIHYGTSYHPDHERLVALDLIFKLLGLVILAAQSSDQLEGIIKYYEGASIVCAEVVNRFGECELPEFGAQELHGLQLRLEFDLHILG
jgi:hypothetical protein